MSDKYFGGIKAGATGVSIHLMIRKKADNTEATGLTFSGVSFAYCRQGGAATALTLVTQTMGAAWVSGGFCEVSSSLIPGLYRLDLPDAAVATGSPTPDFVSIGLVSASDYVAAERIPLSSDVIQTGDSYNRLGTPAGGVSISADLVAISAFVDSVESRLPAVLIGGRLDATIGAMQADVLNAAATAADFIAEVKAQVVAALATDTYADASSVPPASSSLATKLAYISLLASSTTIETATQKRVRNRANTADAATATVSYDGTTLTKGQDV